MVRPASIWLSVLWMHFFPKKMLAAILPLINLLIFLPRGRKRPGKKSLLTVGAVEIISALLKLESEMPS